MTTYRLWPSTNGPSTATSYGGSFGSSTSFEVSGYLYLSGFWWWVCSGGGQSTTAQEFVLWQTTGSEAGTVVYASSVTSGTLSDGWNYVPLAAPLPLTPGVTYNAATAFSGPFPQTAGEFASGGTYAAGIVNGPLSAYSDGTGSNPDPWDNAQCGYQTGSSNPASMYAGEGDSGYVGWLDIQVTTTVPAAASYRLWPGMPSNLGGVSSDTTGYVLATEFSLSQACTLDRIWHYSPSGAASLPTRCAIWNVSTQTEVSGTDNSSPSWLQPGGAAAAAGDGWVYCDYTTSGVTLAGGTDYKVSTYHASGSEWMSVTVGYWSSGAGGSGLTNGVISAPDNASATPGQGSYETTWAYPSLDTGTGENYWVDVEVTPAATTAPYQVAYTGGQVSQDTRRKRRQQALGAVPSVSTAGSFALAPVAFAASGTETEPDTGVLALAPLAFAGTANVANPPPFLPYTGGQAYQSRQNKRRQQVLPATPPAGSFALAPLAFAGTASVSPAATGSFALGALAFTGTAAETEPDTGSFALAPLAFSGTGNVANPVPLLTYTGGQVSRQQRARRRQQVPAPPPPRGSYTLAPLAFAGMATETEPDTGSLALGALGFSGTAVVVANPPPPMTYVGGQVTRQARARRRQQALPQPAPVSTSGSFALAGVAFTSTGTAGSRTLLSYLGGQVFQSRQAKRSQQVLGGTHPVSTSGSFALAPIAFAGTGAATSTFPGAPLGVKVELLLNGTWTDITSYVQQRSPISITRGRPDETQSATPASMTLTLNNRSGDFSPKNSSGAFYPFITRNAQIRLSVNAVSSSLSQYSGYRFWGMVSSWPPAWDQTGNDVYVPIVASGLLRQLQQGAAVGSALYHYVTGLTGNNTPIAYWPCQDASGSTQFYEAMPSPLSAAVPGVWTGTPGLAGSTSFPGSDALPEISGSTWTLSTGVTGNPVSDGTPVYGTPGTYTWTVPPGVTEITGVCVTGAGGGGGNPYYTYTGWSAGGGGGGGASYVRSSIAVTPGEVLTITVGAGGAAGGGAGSASSVTGSGLSGVSASGGGAGGNGGNNSGGSAGSGGSGATYPGGNGYPGAAGSDTVPYSGGGGGSSAGTGSGGNNGAAAGDDFGSYGGTAVAGGGAGGYGAVSYAAAAGSNPGGGGGGGLDFFIGGSSYFFDGASGGAGQVTFTYDGGETPAVPANIVTHCLEIPAGGGIDGAVLADFTTLGTIARVALVYHAGGYLELLGYNSGGTQLFDSGSTAFSADGVPLLVQMSLTPSGTAIDYSLSAFAVSSGPSFPERFASGVSSSSDVWTSGAVALANNAICFGGVIDDGPAATASGSPWVTANTTYGTFGHAVAEAGPSSFAGTFSSSRIAVAGVGAVESTAAPEVIQAVEASPGTSSPVTATVASTAPGSAFAVTVMATGAAGLSDLAVTVGGMSLGLLGSANDSAAEGSDYIWTFWVPPGAVAAGATSAILTFAGTATQVEMQVLEVGSMTVVTASTVVATVTGSAASASIGEVTAVVVDPAGAVTDGTVLGQVIVQHYADSLETVAYVASGYSGEYAADRFLRFCAQEGITGTLIGTDTDTPQMGPQADDKLVNLLQGIEDLDRGQLYEDRTQLGLVYRTRVNLQNQTPGVMYDYPAAMISQPLTPTYDDQLSRNDVTVTRTGGSSARQFAAAGAMSVQDPPNGIGEYTYSLTVAAYEDSQLPSCAQWIVDVGTVDEYHYPSVTIDLSRSATASVFADTADLDVGGYFEITDPPGFLTEDTVKQLCWGFAETLNAFEWTITINAVPESPYSEEDPPTW